MKRVIAYGTGIILLVGCLLLGGYFLEIAISQPCGWLDTLINFTGCSYQLDLQGKGLQVFSKDLTMFAANTGASRLGVWRINDGRLLTKIPGQYGVFSENGKFFIASSMKTISIWRTQDWRLQSTLDLEQKLGLPVFISNVAIAPDMSSFAVVLKEADNPECQIQVWRAREGTLLHKLEGHSGFISSLDYSADGKTLASGSDDHTVRLWRIEDGRWLQTLKEPSENVANVTFAPDNRTIASSSWGSTIRIWRTEDGVLLRTLEGGNRIAYDIAYSPADTVLVSGGTNGLVYLWDLNNGALIRSVRHGWRGIDIGAVAFSSDGKILATAQQDGTVRLFDVKKMLKE